MCRKTISCWTKIKADEFNELQGSFTSYVLRVEHKCVKSSRDKWRDYLLNSTQRVLTMSWIDRLPLSTTHNKKHRTKALHNRIFHGMKQKNHFENSIVQICIQQTGKRMSERKIKNFNLLCLLICARSECDITKLYWTESIEIA